MTVAFSRQRCEWIRYEVYDIICCCVGNRRQSDVVNDGLRTHVCLIDLLPGVYRSGSSGVVAYNDRTSGLHSRWREFIFDFPRPQELPCVNSYSTRASFWRCYLCLQTVLPRGKTLNSYTHQATSCVLGIYGLYLVSLTFLCSWS